MLRPLLALLLGLAAAAAAPAAIEFELDIAVIERALAESGLEGRAPEGEKPRLQRRACPKNSLCHGGRCYKVQCVTLPHCNAIPTGFTC